jgi:hypothetical protein
MKKAMLLLFITTLPFKLNAFDFFGKSNSNLTEDQFHQFENKLKQKKEEIKTNPKADFTYNLFREEELKNDQSCPTCPKYLLLTDEINKVVDKMAKDPKLATSDELPAKINHLKFLYYEQGIHERDGGTRCQRFSDLTPDLKPIKFDGQFKLLAEDTLNFKNITTIQYMNPDLDEVVYYYKGQNENDKDIIVQAIMTRNGGKFRYYRYTPSEKEANPYNLPDMTKTYGPKYEPRPADNYTFKDKADAPAPQSTTPGTAAVGTENYKLTFKAEVEKRNKWIPKNIHFVEGKIDQDLFGDVKIKANSDLSAKGNQAHLALKNGASDLVVLDVDTKLNGKTEHKVTIPFSVRVVEDVPEIKGGVEVGSHAQVLNLNLTDKNVVYAHTEFRKNTDSGRTSYVIARDMQIAPNEAVSVAYGKGEDEKRYASLRHVKNLKNNITLILDARVDQDKKVTVMYQMSAKF